MATSLMTTDTDTEADAVRRTRLRRMQGVAGGLLLVAAVVYLLTHGRDGFLGFVNAGAEASMVGAIADWFAVTALFRHPLGLPIPHTALVPRKKDEFGKSLEEFFAENFLQEQVIRDRLTQAEIARRTGAWLAEPTHAARVVREVSSAAVVVVIVLASRVDHRGWALGLGLLLAGVTGNLVDRMLRAPGPFRGQVVDFFALPHWPVFNVADICIDVAGAIFVLLLIRGVRLDGSRHEEQARHDS